MRKSFWFYVIALSFALSLGFFISTTIKTAEALSVSISGQNPPSVNISGQNPPSTNISGQNPSSGSVGLKNPLGQNTTIYSLLNSIVGWLITLGGAIAVLMIVIGAFQMLFSGGDAERFKTGKQTILYTVIGYGIIILAKSITSLIQYMLNVS